jgi:sterol desaturase/sphingolipid hydroxylase (fatty acid hydroxylase superfamily)
MVSIFDTFRSLWRQSDRYRVALCCPNLQFAASHFFKRSTMLPVILATFVFCFLVERLRPGWTLPRVPTWPLRVLAMNAVQLVVVLLAGVSWERWFSAASLFQLSAHVSPATGGLMAYFIATFIFYWWHRVRHTNDTLWRLFHQIHHSPQRLEVITSFYKHPAEMVVNSLIGSLLVFATLGLSAEAGAVYTLCTALGEFFYHTNIKTPRWVGFFFQRPEMHRIHHQHARHKNNYGDITWWDMLFGTYENPREWTYSCGFDAAREERLWDMLCWRDVHAEPARTVQHNRENHSQ